MWKALFIGVRQGSGRLWRPTTSTQAADLSAPIPARPRPNSTSWGSMEIRAGGFYPRLGYFSVHRQAEASTDPATANPPDRPDPEFSDEQILARAFLPTADQATARRNVVQALDVAERLDPLSSTNAPSSTTALTEYIAIRALRLLLLMDVVGDDVLGVVSAILSGESRVVYFVLM